MPFLCSFGENAPNDSEFLKFERFYCCIYDPLYKDRKVDILLNDNMSNNETATDSENQNAPTIDYVDDINLVRNENFFKLTKKGKKRIKVKVGFIYDCLYLILSI